MSLSKIQKAEEKYLLHTYDRHPVLLTHGKGAYVYAEDGSKYLDFLSGIGVMALGYSHPAITKVIKEQAGKLVHCSNLFYTEYPSALAQKLAKLSGMDRVFFSNSGTEAWEGALKIARVGGQQQGFEEAHEVSGAGELLSRTYDGLDGDHVHREVPQTVCSGNAGRNVCEV